MNDQDVGVETPLNGQTGEATTYTVVQESTHRPSLVRAVCAAVRQVRIEQLEARLRRLRQGTPQEVSGYDGHVISVKAEPRHERAGHASWAATLRAYTPMRQLRWWGLVGGAAVVLVTARVLQEHVRRTGVGTEGLQAVMREVTVLREQVDAHASSVETLGRRLEAATQEVADYARQLTNQTSVLSMYGQQIDAQAAQLTSLGESVATAAKQIKGLDQKVTVQGTQIIAHDKQLAARATQLSAVRSRTTATTQRTAVTTPNPGPPTLEALSAPLTRTPAAQKLNEAPSTAPDATSARPAISLPPGLGAAGLRGRAESQHGAPR